MVFVNPRRIETPERGVGNTIQIRPDTDLYFLAAFAAEIDLLGRFDAAVMARHGAHVAEQASSSPPTPPTASPGSPQMPADVVLELAAWVIRHGPRCTPPRG